jgi:hypothetical protein
MSLFRTHLRDDRSDNCFVAEAVVRLVAVGVIAWRRKESRGQCARRLLLLVRSERELRGAETLASVGCRWVLHKRRGQ